MASVPIKCICESDEEFWNCRNAKSGITEKMTKWNPYLTKTRYLTKWLCHATRIQKSGDSGGQKYKNMNFRNWNFQCFSAFLTYLKTSKPYKSGCDFTLSSTSGTFKTLRNSKVLCAINLFPSFFWFRRDAITCVRRPKMQHKLDANTRSSNYHPIFHTILSWFWGWKKRKFGTRVKKLVSRSERTEK